MNSKPYILGSVVARGGMAEIYRGLHVGQDGFQRLVAIKRILPHHAQNAEFTEMFKDEAHIGQRLQHANIVKVEGFDIIENSPAIIMEFVDGSDLRALLAATENRKQTNGKKSFMPIDLCVYIIAEAARGLHYAHTRRDDISGKPLNIVHRDISPQNILLSWEGEVKVTDFGIAAAERDFKQTETKAGIVKGKYSYMSPEQISGKKCDARTDVFALSIVLWEMLTMQRLFISDNEFEVIEMVRHCRLPGQLREKNPAISEELEAIVLRGLAKDPRRRYESMEALERTLRAFLSASNRSMSANEVSTFVKITLTDKQEQSKVEMRKLLTSSKSSADRSGGQGTGFHAPVELTIDASPGEQTNLTVGRASKTPTSIPPVQTSHLSNHRPLGPTSAHRATPNRQFEAKPLFQHKQKTEAKHQSWQTLIFAFASILLIGGAFAFKHYQRAAKQALTISVKSEPETVRIKVNDVAHGNGRFVTTPTKIRLEPGLNSLEFSRTGYRTEKILIDTETSSPGQAPTVRLRPNAVFAPVRIEYRGADSATININSGFFRKRLTTKQNIVQIPDLLSGVPADLSAINTNRQLLMRCAFTPSQTNDKRPMIVIVDAAKKVCEVVKPTLQEERR
jgi:serine/threonine protein kinase